MQIAVSQDANVLVRRGNKAYRSKQFEKAAGDYSRAVEAAPQDAVARFNYANALFRTGKFSEAGKTLEEALNTPAGKTIEQESFYNKGVAHSRQNQLEQSIEAYKQAVRLDPSDVDARHNLQKALLELKKRNPPQPKEQKQQQQKQKREQKPQKENSRLNKRQVEQLLRALRQKEQQVQQKMQQNKTRTTTQPEKDW
jgi:Ca-activated chloride channel homolog